MPWYLNTIEDVFDCEKLYKIDKLYKFPYVNRFFVNFKEAVN